MSPWITDLRLSLRLLWREARSGELTLVLLSLVLAITVSTAISLFSSRLDRAMTDNASDMLGADVRVRSSTPLPDEWLDRAAALQLQTARTLSFPSMVLAGDDMALAALKAVDDGYPLRGGVEILRPGSEQSESVQQGPAPGEAWVEPRLLALLGVGLGDTLDVGGSSLTITGVITREADRGGNFYSLSPRVMVHWQQLEGSPMLGPGSRVIYRLLLQGDEQALQAFRDATTLDANQRFESLQDGNRAMSRSLDRARRYLGLAAVLAVVLSAVAITISVRRYAVRHFDISALLRTFGLSRTRVHRVFAWQLMVVGLLAALAGGAAAMGLQAGLVAMLAGLIPEGLPPASLMAWISGIAAGLVCLFGFGLPQLWPLARISPLRVLRRDLEPTALSGWLVYGLALMSVTVLLWLFTGDALLSIAVMGGGVLVITLLAALLVSGLQLCQRQLRGRALPPSFRLAWQHLGRDPVATSAQILAFALPVMVMLVIGLLRTDLLADWQKSLPQGTPNIFAMNIQGYEQEALTQSLEDAGIAPQPMYAMVPMRLVAVNAVPVSELPIRRDRAIDRDLISTTAEQLPANNEVVEGRWEDTVAGPAQVSVEVELAERLNLSLGDELTFRVAGQEFGARISSLRQVDWTSMTPNFYMMLSPDLLSSVPSGYLTSFYLPDSSEQALTDLIRSYPGVTFLDTRFLLSQLQALVARISLAVELILAFVLVGAVLVMLSILLTTTRERLMQGAVLRTLGAARSQLQRAQWTEFALLGLMSALASLVGAELLIAGLYTLVLDITYQGPGLYWLVLPPVVALTLAILGSLMLRPVVTVPPLEVLRRG